MRPVRYPIESREIRGITLKVLYLLVIFSITATAGIMSSYFSLKNDNQLLNTQIEILKVQLRQLDRRLDNIELHHSGDEPHIAKTNGLK
jgi:hypothetical protein